MVVAFIEPAFCLPNKALKILIVDVPPNQLMR